MGRSKQKSDPGSENQQRSKRWQQFFKKHTPKGCLRLFPGFTLIELLIVIVIIAILSTTGINIYKGAVEKARVAQAALFARQLIKAVELYYIDMEFYPPDVNRGWDPGFTEQLPSNPDIGTAGAPTGGYATAGENCDHCPTDWEDILDRKWGGPYITRWPNFTPWNGKYDYNYWGSAVTRSGCPVPAGIYVGIQGDYNGNNSTIPTVSEEELIEKNIESENCINGESQMLLTSLE